MSGTGLSLARPDFPPGFVFGTATSAYQIEGHAFGGAGSTHWDTFAATPGNVVRGENGAIACDHYHRFESDLDLVRDAGFDAYRFSTSWARILPEGLGAPNPEGLDFYDRLVDGLCARGLKPFLTLYHWELPSPLADRGGWANGDIPGWFADFADLVARRLGDRIHAAAPVNEPWCVGYLSHFLGQHAPGLRDIRATARAMHHILVAQGRAIAAMRAAGMDNLGAIFNFEPAFPADASEGARAAARRYDAIYNRFFIEGVFRGAYPDEVLDAFAPHMPRGWQDDFPTIQAPLDWVGVNYYTRKLIGAAPGLWPALTEVPGPLPKTQMDWEIYPEGLADLVTRIARENTGPLPLYVTENGCAWPDEPDAAGQVHDSRRIEYLDRHLRALKGAVDQGVPVRGYFVWSLLDNYEWALGYEKRFGIVHVDFETLERRPKASYHALRKALLCQDGP